MDTTREEGAIDPAGVPASGTPERVLARAWYEAGTRLVFGVPGGGSNLDMIGAAEAESLRFILTHTETAAAIMAGTVAELTGTPGVCIATRGPGAASAVNGVAQALLDRQPLFVVTDLVSEADRERISHQRLDQHALFAAVTKTSYTFGTVAPEVARTLVASAVDGCPGPVHVEIDRAAPALDIDAREDASEATVEGPVAEQARALLGSAARLVVVAGVGAVVGAPEHRARVRTALEAIARASGAPILTTYKARGIVDDDSEWTAGVATGATIESPVLHSADVILGVGLDPVELIPAAWPYAAPLVTLSGWSVDDSTYFGEHVHADLVGDLGRLVEQAARWVVPGDWAPDAGQQFQEQARHELEAAVPAEPLGLTPQEVIATARRLSEPGTVASVDAGAHMLAAVPLWRANQPGELLTSSGLATMGYALPAAIAAALVHPDRAVICFTGDGGLGMVLGELETAARLEVRVIVVVFNDSTLSLIAAKQRPSGQGGANAVQYRPVDFAGIARASGMAAAAVSDVAEYEDALRAALGRPGPTLIDVRTDPSAYPEVLNAVRGQRAP